MEKDIQETEDSSQEPSTEGQETKIIEEDGEVYLRSDEEASDADSSGEQSVPASDESSEESQENPVYKGKSREDILEMHLNAQQKITEQGEELGNLRKEYDTSLEDLSNEEVFESLSLQDVELALQREKDKLEELNPYDPEFAEQQTKVSQIESDRETKKVEQAVQDRFNSADNQKFVDKQKERIRAEGIDINEQDFNEVTDIARHYVEDGILTDRSYQKALIDKYGAEVLPKYYKMSGEEKARRDIKNAKAKETNTIDVKGSGKNAKLKAVGNMSRVEMRKAFDNLSLDELEQLSRRINK